MRVDRVLGNSLARGTIMFGLLGLFATTAFAQGNSGAVRPSSEVIVLVTDPVGAVISQAEVEFKSDVNVSVRTSLTGAARVLLPFGSYLVTITSRGFKPTRVKDFVVNTSRPALLTVALQIAPGTEDCFTNCGDGVPLPVPTITLDLPNTIRLPTANLPMAAIPPQSSQTDPNLARLQQAQKYQSEGFQPVFCFAGQARFGGKRLSRSPFSVFEANDEKKCCGDLVKSGRTDQHGHFFAEPLREGRYFAKFEAGGQEQLLAFAVFPGYERCDGTHLEINFTKAGEPTTQDHVDIDDSGEPCRETEPHCYRK